MRSITIISILMLILFSKTPLACDICGCGTGGSFMGMIPNFGSNQLSLRNTFRGFNHPNTPLNFNGESRVLRDEFFQMELSYRHFSENKWSVFINVPYRMNTRYETLRTTQIQGLGDINFSVNYTVLNTSDSMSHRLKHTLLLGAGIKLANGKFMQRDETKVMLPLLFQIGTGATNFTAHLYYTIRYRRWGLNLNGLHVRTGKNELEYEVGNKSQGTMALFWKKDFSFQRTRLRAGTKPFDESNNTEVSILPSIGLNLENSDSDKLYDETRQYTGGSHLFGVAGLDVLFSKLAISLFYQAPFYSSTSGPQPVNRPRLGLALNWRI